MGALGIWVALVSFIHLLYLSAAGDTLSQHQFLGEDQTLVSVGETFELGFFKSGNSSNRYVGIWYAGIPSRQIVWVANRENPINSSGNGSLTITPDGNLNILDSNKIIWSTGMPGAAVSDTYVLQLLESGNLVLGNSRGRIWQSFDHPSHAMLPGMKMGYDFRDNREWHLTSWKSESDPSPGSYTWIMYPKGPPEAYVMEGSTRVSRSGAWNGHGWGGSPAMKSNTYFNFECISSKDELYYQFEMRNKSIKSPLLLSVDGRLERWVWTEQKWKPYWKLPADVCETYMVCGGYGVCQNDGSTLAYCNCLNGFEPVNSVEWGLRDWSHGCTIRTPLSCEKGDDFVRVGQLKLPDTTNTSWDSGKGIDECKDWCSRNCSCRAYAVTGEGGSGCINWFSELVDIREFTQGGQDLYLRVASSEIQVSTHVFNNKKKLKIVISLTVVFVAISGFLVGCFLWWRRHKGREKLRQEQSILILGVEISKKLGQNGKRAPEFTLFDFSHISKATNGFSNENKLGEGGFGPVYKGILTEGQEIAVKRLSTSSGQGLEEFKNEIRLIAKLQHSNLVRLLGCCIQKEEKILIYEYMQNKSLDFFLFDKERGSQLDWNKRLHIIEGIAQGLIYLHKHSRLRIIHRDLKASNVLLDAKMNPKISDFGMARIFNPDETVANTIRVVGTYGYMSPEYIIKGIFSVKSDVFSFGVLLLEIVSGKRNSSFHQYKNAQNLVGYAWELWLEAKLSDLTDPSLGDISSLNNITRCIHVALLCVQEKAADRPTMTEVITMLSSDTATLADPKQPAYFTMRVPRETDLPRKTSSVNNVTVTSIDGR